MAFLDNSGDIILDAVLTEEGRRRMANGNFNIAKFAFGDDEINYGLYNKSHASGSAYYDLEILQTPVLQANTGINASINYGLMSFVNPNLLYMPTMRRNEKIPEAKKLRDNIYYLAVKDGVTFPALKTGFGLDGANQLLESGDTSHGGIILETGLDTAEIAATTQNKSNYITSNGLQDTNFAVSVDTRFIAAVLGPDARASFTNSGGAGSAVTNLTMVSVPATNSDLSRVNYASAKVRAVNNNVVYRVDDKIPDTNTSAIKGPRASVVSLNFTTKIFSDDAFTKHGKTGQTVASAAGTYKYIDTTVKVVSSTGLVEQLPIRIIQKE